ncbi:MAG TPA: winged helix-turn-helix domain-containing protein [Bryobacteraceae bacterium]|nr:winged helix-turn-helix domain-containing protein [Bryobacteraceae bacterium]
MPRENCYRFGDFELNPSERALTRLGASVALPPKTFDALLHMVRNAEHLVTKDELMSALWPSTFVSEANLTNIIVSLRKVLGQDAIRTVSKHGYRLVLGVQGIPGVSREIYEQFVRANELTVHRSLESMTRALQLYWICIAEDPTFAPAWAWLGRCCWFLAKFSSDHGDHVTLADAAFRRAFAIDPNLAAAHQFYTPVEADLGRAQDALARLLGRIACNPAEPQNFAGLVQVFRFCGLLSESLAAHRRVSNLDSTIATSVPHTFFLAGDYAETIDSYGGRTGYYLDAAAWASLGDRERARELLCGRLARMPLSGLMRGLMESLAAILQNRFDEADTCMRSMSVAHEPEVLVYLARHYSYIGKAESAVDALRRAAQFGFVCAPATLRGDPWLSSVRTHAEFESVMRLAEMQVEQARAMLRRHEFPLVAD